MRCEEPNLAKKLKHRACVDGRERDSVIFYSNHKILLPLQREWASLFLILISPAISLSHNDIHCSTFSLLYLLCASETLATAEVIMNF
jgi:hypothetical protein